MNLNHVLTEIEKIDPEVYARLDTRRNTMKQFTKAGGKIALTAVPFLFGGMFKKAYGGTNAMPTIVVELLQHRVKHARLNPVRLGYNRFSGNCFARKRARRFPHLRYHLARRNAGIRLNVRLYSRRHIP